MVHPSNNLFISVKKGRASTPPRRKTLRNSLKSLIKNDKVKELEIFNKRPEALSVDAFINLTNILEFQTT